MKLIPDWRRVLTRAWSIRLMLLAALFSVAEEALPLMGDFIEPGLLARLSAFVTAGAIVARILAQRNMDDE